MGNGSKEQGIKISDLLRTNPYTLSETQPATACAVLGWLEIAEAKKPLREVTLGPDANGRIVNRLRGRGSRQ